MALVYWGSSISLLTSSFSAQCSELPLLALSLSLSVSVSLFYHAAYLIVPFPHYSVPR